MISAVLKVKDGHCSLCGLSKEEVPNQTFYVLQVYSEIPAATVIVAPTEAHSGACLSCLFALGTKIVATSRVLMLK